MPLPGRGGLVFRAAPLGETGPDREQDVVDDWGSL